MIDYASLLDGTPYRARGVMAEGGMGLVLDAEHAGGRVVVKVLRPDTAAEPGFRERLLAEAEVLARLRHPNLVAVQDFGVTPRGEPYLVMERLEGKPLSEIIARGGLPVPAALAIARQALLGLGFAHEHGVVHRDVKPSNLIVCGPEGAPEVKVIDFGIAKLAPRGELEGMALKHAMAPGEVLGSPGFMAPEQLLGRAVTQATDIYAMGLVTYQMVGGRHPFAHHSTVEAIRDAHLAEMPLPVSELRGEPVPAALERALLRAVAKAPQDRFPTAASFAEALEHHTPDVRDLVTLAAEAPAPAVTTLPSAVEGYMPYTAPLEIAVVSARPDTHARVTLRSALTRWCWVAAVVGLVWHAGNATMMVGALGDPAAVAPEASEQVRRLAAAALPRHLILLGLAVSLALILKGARIDPDRAMRLRRVWVGSMMAAIVVAAGIDLAFAPVAAAYTERVAPVLEPIALPFAVIHALGATALQIAVVLLVRRWRP